MARHQKTRRKSEPLPVSGLLDAVLAKIDRRGRMQGYRVWTFWKDEVGEVLASHVTPKSFDDGILTVTTDAPAWMQEMRFLQEDIRTRLNGRLGSEVIREIRAVAG